MPTGKPKLRKYALLRNAWESRLFGCLALAIAVPTVGVLATLLVALAPIALALAVAPHLTGVAVALGFALFLASAVGLAVGSLRLASRAAMLRMKNGHVVVGEDGIAVRRFLQPRFHPWSEVDHVRIEEGVVVLALAGGSTEQLIVGDPFALETAAKRAKDRFDVASRSDPVRVLACDGLPDDRWLERVRVATSESAYREGAVSADELVRVAEDPTQSADQRVGAAAALAKADPDIVRRVRVATELTANPELATALEQAIDGELGVRQARRAIAQR